MGAGLIFTPVSVYQMTRSALVLWVGLFSVIYLGRRLSRVELVSLFTVCLGVFVVGLSSASNAPGALPTADAGKVVLGVSLILFAQILCVLALMIISRLLWELIKAAFPIAPQPSSSSKRRSWGAAL